MTGARDRMMRRGMEGDNDGGGLKRSSFPLS